MRGVGESRVRSDVEDRRADLVGDDLVDALRRGENRAYEAAIRQYGGRLLGTATRLLGSPDEARDCVQETFLQVHRKIDTFEARAQLGTWLHRICVNACLMKLRKRARHNETTIDELLPEFDANDCRIEPAWHIAPIEDLLEQAETRQLVHDSIAELPEDYRIALMLRDIEGYSTAETAKTLDITEGAVKTRLHRARAALKKQLEPLFDGDGL